MDTIKGTNNKKLLFLIFGLLFLLSIIFLYYILRYDPNKKVLARVGNKKITVADLNNYTYSLDFNGSPEKPTSISQKDKYEYTKALIEYEIANQVAESEGFAANEEDIEKSINNSLGQDYKKLTDTQKKVVRDIHKKTINLKRVKDLLFEYKEGRYILFRFDKYVDYGDLNFEGLGEEKRISAQKLYAEKLSKEIYQKLMEGKIDYDKATDIVGNDNQIGATAFLPVRPNIYGEFTKEEYMDELSLFDTKIYLGFKEGIVAEKNSFTKPYLIKAKTNNGFEEIAYVIVFVKEFEQGKYQSYDAWYQKEQKNKNVEIYIKEESIIKSIPSFLQKKVIDNLRPQKSYGCIASYSGTHKTNITVKLEYLTASGTLANINSNNITTDAGSSSKANGLQIYNSSCASTTTVFSVTKGTGSDGMMNLGDTVDGTAALVNCNYTSVAHIDLPDTINVGGTAGSRGHWDIDDSGAYGTWLKSFDARTGKISLDLGGINNWANGTQTAKRVVWYPDWATTTYKTSAYIETSVVERNGTSVSILTNGEIERNDLVMVRQIVANYDTVTIPQIWIRNNVNNNGISGTGTGTISSPYTIRQISGGTSSNSTSTVCAQSSGATSACLNLLNQAAGSYSTPSYDTLQWRSASTGVYPSGVISGNWYDNAIWFFRVPATAPIDTYVSTKMSTWADSSTDGTYSTDTLSPQVQSNLQKLKIKQKYTLSVNISPPGSGRVYGGIGGEIGEIDTTTSASDRFNSGTTTSLEIDQNNSLYQFSSWSGTGCTTAGANPNSINVTMSDNRSCTANFTLKPPIASLSANPTVTRSATTLNFSSVNATSANLKKQDMYTGSFPTSNLSTQISGNYTDTPLPYYPDSPDQRYKFTATNSGGSSEVYVSVTVNRPPNLTLVTPVNNTTFTATGAGATVNVTLTSRGADEDTPGNDQNYIFTRYWTKSGSTCSISSVNETSSGWVSLSTPHTYSRTVALSAGTYCWYSYGNFAQLDATLPGAYPSTEIREFTIVDPPPPSCSLTATPTSVIEGNSVMLNFSSSNATSGNLYKRTESTGTYPVTTIASGIAGSVTNVPSPISTVAPNNVQRYRFIANGPGGSATCERDVTVNSNLPPIITLNSPSTNYNTTAALYNGNTSVTLSVTMSDPDLNETGIFYIRYWQKTGPDCSTSSVNESSYGWGSLPYNLNWNVSLQPSSYCWTSYGYRSWNYNPSNPDLSRISAEIREFKINQPAVTANCNFLPSVINEDNQTTLTWDASASSSGVRIYGPAAVFPTDRPNSGSIGPYDTIFFGNGTYTIIPKDASGNLIPNSESSCNLAIRQLSCTLKPERGNTPLLAEIKVNATNFSPHSYDFILNNLTKGTNLVTKNQASNTFYYNINQEGTIEAIVRAKDSEGNVLIETSSCVFSTVTAINPAGGGGGEVTP